MLPLFCYSLFAMNIIPIFHFIVKHLPDFLIRNARVPFDTRAPSGLISSIPAIQALIGHIAHIPHPVGFRMDHLRLQNRADPPDRDVGPNAILGEAFNNIIVGLRPQFIGTVDLNQLSVVFAVPTHTALEVDPPEEEALVVDADDSVVQRVVSTQVELPDVPLLDLGSDLTPQPHKAPCQKQCDNFHNRNLLSFCRGLQNPVLGLVTFYFNTLFDFCQKHKIRAQCDLCS